MVVLSNPDTYGTRKCNSWCADIHKFKDPEYKHPESQLFKNPKTQHFLHLRNLGFFLILGFLDCWILGFLDFGVLHLCFQSVETAPKLDSEKKAFASVFTVF